MEYEVWYFYLCWNFISRNYYLGGYSDREYDESDILHFFNRFGNVITQRYHGIVLSNIVETSVLPIYHHDKLNTSAESLSYYEISKDKLIDSFNKLNKNDNFIAKNYEFMQGEFDQLKSKVNDILNT